MGTSSRIKRTIFFYFDTPRLIYLCASSAFSSMIATSASSYLILAGSEKIVGKTHSTKIKGLISSSWKLLCTILVKVTTTAANVDVGYGFTSRSR